MGSHRRPTSTSAAAISDVDVSCAASSRGSRSTGMIKSAVLDFGKSGDPVLKNGEPVLKNACDCELCQRFTNPIANDVEASRNSVMVRVLEPRAPSIPRLLVPELPVDRRQPPCSFAEEIAVLSRFLPRL